MKNLFMITLLTLTANVAQADFFGDLGDSLGFTEKPVDCTVDTPSYRLEDYITIASEKMETVKCRGEFPSYIRTFMNIGKNAPGKENLTLIGSFVAAQVKKGNIPKSQGQNTIKTYFNREFVTYSNLPKVQMTSVLCEKTHDGLSWNWGLKPTLAADAKRELKKKKLGIMEVMGDPGAYRSSQNLYDQLNVLYHATCVSKGLQANN